MAATALPRSDPERPGGGRVAVATLAIGAKARRVFALAQPLMAAYAQRIGAEFVVIEELSSGRSPQASKCELARLLARFDRVVYLDCDLLVHPDCPDLTTLVPEAMLGALVESRIDPRQHAVDAVVAQLGGIGWDDGAYFNSGVMVLSHLHRDVLKELGDTWDHYTDAMHEQTYFNWLVRRAGLPVFDIGPRYNHMVISGWPTADARIVHFAGIGFRAVAVAPPDVWTAKHSDMQDLLNAAEGVATWTFDAERIEPDRGQVERSEDFFSRLASAEPHEGVLGRSVATALPRGRYELRIVGLAAAASARLGVAVISLPERCRIAFASREARSWDRPLVFEIAEPFKTVVVELTTQGSPVSIEHIVLTQTATGAWGAVHPIAAPADGSLSAIMRSEAVAALGIACELRRQLAQIHEATVSEILERQRDREHFAAAHEQIQARLDTLADENARSAHIRTELETRLAAAIEKAETTAATLAVTQNSLAAITAERDRLADQGRRWFEAAVPSQGQTDPADRHTGSPRSWINPSLRRRNLLRRARNAAARHRWELATRYYGELLDADPRRPAIWVQFGNNLKDAGKFPEAERAYRRALEYQEDSADTHLQLGYVLALQDRLPEAAASFGRSLTLAPNSDQARAALRALGWTEAEITASTAETAVSREKQPQRFRAQPWLPIVGNRWSGIFRR